MHKKISRLIEQVKGEIDTAVASWPDGVDEITLSIGEDIFIGESLINGTVFLSVMQAIKEYNGLSIAATDDGDGIVYITITT